MKIELELFQETYVIMLVRPFLLESDLDMKGVNRLILVLLFHLVKSDLSDFGGDVKQYMSLLQGSSAFSFSPQKGIK